MKIRYSQAARDDLRQLKAYLTVEFGAAVAAKSVAKIVSDIATLKQHRSLARPLSGKVGRDTPYLYLLCGRHSFAILSEGANLYSVIRILDGRTDYVKTVFDGDSENNRLGPARPHSSIRPSLSNRKDTL